MPVESTCNHSQRLKLSEFQFPFHEKPSQDVRLTQETQHTLHMAALAGHERAASHSRAAASTGECREVGDTSHPGQLRSKGTALHKAQSPRQNIFVVCLF